MKLVLATPLYPPEIGGPATYAKALVDGLPQKGIEVELVKFSEVRRWPRFLRHFLYERRVSRALKSADAVLALDPVSTGLPAMRAARTLRKKFLVKIVGDYAWEQGRQRFGVVEELDQFIKTSQKNFFVKKLQEVETRVAQASARVIVPSQYLKGIVAAWGIPAEKIDVIHNAVPIDDIGQVPPRVSALARPLYVSVGRLVPWKGFEGVIEAAAKNGASLAIVGEGPLHASHEDQARRALGARGVFTGALSHADTLAVIKAADVFVLNSSYEGLSHVLIEALRLGKAIVATNAGGNPEVITHGLVPVGDAAALAAALKGAAPQPLAGGDAFSEAVMLDATAALLKSL